MDYDRLNIEDLMKMDSKDLTDEEFIEYCKTILKYLKKRYVQIYLH